MVYELHGGRKGGGESGGRGTGTYQVISHALDPSMIFSYWVCIYVHGQFVYVDHSSPWQSLGRSSLPLPCFSLKAAY